MTVGSSIQQAAREYVQHGWPLVPLDHRAKGTDRPDWNLRENAIDSPAKLAHINGGNIGLALAWARIATLDVDDYAEAELVLADNGVDLNALMLAPDALQIRSRENRAKLLYRLPDGMTPPRSHTIKAGKRTIYELRCATVDGKTVQDVLPPSIHPDTGRPYLWHGDWHQVPPLPQPLLEHWRTLGVAGGQHAPIEIPEVTAADLAAGMALLAPKYRAIVEGGADEGDRSEAVYAVIAHLALRGATDAQIIAVLTHPGNGIADKPLSKRRPAAWLAPQIAKKRRDIPPPNPSGDPPPVDLLRPMAAPPLRSDDVPDVLAHFADAHARATGFDVSILLAAGIGAACAMLSDAVRLCVGPRSGWFESGRLWLVVIGGPGSGKTPATKTAMAPVYAVHREAWGAWCKANEGREEPDPAPALYTSDSTTEALAELLRGNERGLLYCVDELESWLASHDAYRSGAGKDRGEWLRLFDGGPHQVHRIKRGAFFVPNWGASLLSATTPAALRKLAPRLPDDGLLQRLLLILVRPRELPDGAMLRVETRHQAEAWDEALRRLHALPAAIVQMSGEARAAFEAEQADLHRLTLAFEDAHPPYAAHLAKRAAMLARLALVFHALEAPAVTDNLAGETMHRAVRFMRRQERHAQAVYGSMLGADTGMALAKAAARSILAAGLQSFNRRELAHRCKAFRGADEPTRQAALSLLCDCAWLTSDIATVTHGAHWTVDPRVHTLFAEHGEVAKRQRETIRGRMNADEADE